MWSRVCSGVCERESLTQAEPCRFAAAPARSNPVRWRAGKGKSQLGSCWGQWGLQGFGKLCCRVSHCWNTPRCPTTAGPRARACCWDRPVASAMVAGGKVNCPGHRQPVSLPLHVSISRQQLSRRFLSCHLLKCAEVAAQKICAYQSQHSFLCNLSPCRTRSKPGQRSGISRIARSTAPPEGIGFQTHSVCPP